MLAPQEIKQVGMNAQFADKVAIVTGAASGIGRATALRLAAGGASVVVVDRDADGARTVMSELAQYGARAVAEVCDVREPEAAERIVAAQAAALGGVDILVNNAGVGAQCDVLETELDLWHDMLAVNLTSCFAWSKAAAPRMRARGGGRIVNVSSHAGLLGSTGRGAYSAAKGGMLALTRVMAVEWAEFGITVNAVTPGAIATPMTARSHKVARTVAWMNRLPLQRYGQPDDVAGAIVYLCSADAAYVTGQTLCVDGGFTAAGVLVREAWKPDVAE